MLKYIVLFLLFYFLIRFIFGFVIPVARGAIKMKRKIREMQEQANAYNANAYNASGGNVRTESEHKSSSQPGTSKDDYIEFEEVK